MPTVGLLTKTVAATEKESIGLFAQFEPRLTWLEALKAGYKMKKICDELRSVLRVYHCGMCI